MYSIFIFFAHPYRVEGVKEKEGCDLRGSFLFATREGHGRLGAMLGAKRRLAEDFSLFWRHLTLDRTKRHLLWAWISLLYTGNGNGSLLPHLLRVYTLTLSPAASIALTSPSKVSFLVCPFTTTRKNLPSSPGA